MNKTELLEKIANIENRRFNLSMKDRWTNEDYEKDHNMLSELRSLKKSLELVG